MCPCNVFLQVLLPRWNISINGLIFQGHSWTFGGFIHLEYNEKEFCWNAVIICQTPRTLLIHTSVKVVTEWHQHLNCEDRLCPQFQHQLWTHVLYGHQSMELTPSIALQLKIISVAVLTSWVAWSVLLFFTWWSQFDLIFFFLTRWHNHSDFWRHCSD